MVVVIVIGVTIGVGLGVEEMVNVKVIANTSLWETGNGKGKCESRNDG